jgi:HTH-type transcriptional regulator/antitoxin HipB
MKTPVLPIGKIKSAKDVGHIIVQRRKQQGLLQEDIAGLGPVGKRFLSELENGKGTVQFDKVMEVLELLGLEVIIHERQ